MIYSINIDSTDPSIDQEVDLDGTAWRLIMRWNERDGYWYLTLRDLDDEEIAPSRRMVAGAAFLRYVTGTNRPAGELTLDATPTRDGLGVDQNLIYLDAEEVAAL